MDWHLDVDSSYPGAVLGSKGAAVLRLRGNVSWVHTAVRQVGPYLLKGLVYLKYLILVREDFIE